MPRTHRACWSDVIDPNATSVSPSCSVTKLFPALSKRSSEAHDPADERGADMRRREFLGALGSAAQRGRLRQGRNNRAGYDELAC